MTMNEGKDTVTLFSKFSLGEKVEIVQLSYRCGWVTSILFMKEAATKYNVEYNNDCGEVVDRYFLADDLDKI